MKSNLLFITHAVDYDHTRVRFICSWLEEFSKYHEKVHVIALQKGNTKKLPDNIIVHSLGKEEGTSKLQQILRFRKLVKKLKNEYDIVFCHNWPGWAILGSPTWKRHKKPMLYWKCNKVKDPLVYIAGKLTTRILTHSKWSFPYPMPYKTDYLSHGIDMDIFKPEKKKKKKVFEVMSVGRFASEKRFPDLLKAFRELENCKLIIVTSIANKANRVEHEKIKLALKKAKVEDKIEFLFDIPNKDMGKLYNRADLTINMTETGALDKVVFESMACGTPVLINNLSFEPYLEELWQKLHFKANAEDIARKIEHFRVMTLDDRNKLSKRLRELAVKHASVPQHIANYEKIIARYVQ